MGLKRTTQPSLEPVTLADAKLHLREDLADVANDAYITSLIVTARQHCEDRIQRTLISSSWTLILDSFPAAIELTRPPLISITSLRYIDPAGVLQTLSPADYIVDTGNSETGYVVPAFNKTWPDTQARINAVEVLYVAGYGAAAASVPTPLRQWMLLAIGDMYSTRNASAERPVVPHNFADSLLDAYKIWSI